METEEKSGIIYKQWKAASPRAALLLVHGFGGHSARWEFLSSFFLKDDISSYALDLQGFGETKGLEGNADYFNVYFEDILRLYNIIKKENPGKKIFLVGESMGGLISFLLSAMEPELFAGLICISPLFQDKLKYSPLDYVKILFSLLFNPMKKFSVRFNSQMCTRDSEYQKMMDSDYREIRVARSKLLFDIAIGEIRAQFLKSKIKIPVLFLLAGQDKMVDSELSKKVLNSLKTKDKQLLLYPDMYHALSIDLDREQVFEDMLKWVQDRLREKVL